VTGGPCTWVLEVMEAAGLDLVEAGPPRRGPPITTTSVMGSCSFGGVCNLQLLLLRAPG
jgi:hypothetical protein